ncbi:MAG TPA: ABC transporter substrate-binding protein [Candidatus Eisenbergiella merdavium]|uniref:ABC transporter substrate-binding protein n=2 Tax=Eisenbergiella TaxID=1432051 RepID=A0A9D2SEG8_9FIRM|nr:ABC transporter substrate-binding protein [Candidatus Eisenbergiella merdigallinarum]HJC22262.1 ABC transporter substrate-binding protein [Candidatus Eisenbergiella merdavium]
MKKKKLLAIVMSLCLTAAAFSGCGSSAGSSSGTGTAESAQSTAAEAADSTTGTEAAESAAASLDSLPAAVGEGTITATPEMYSAIDLSKPYTVNMYLIGDTPNDWDKVLALANEYLEPFNTTLNVTIMSWSDYQTMYSLVLAGGEQVDLIFTAPWCYMYTEAAKGSFYELTDEFIAANMPLTSKYQAEESWDETTISGKTIAVPSNVASPMGKIVAIRQDLADKYGISELTSWEDYMNFCLTIAEQETPESGIYAMPASGNNSELWDVYRQQYDTFEAVKSGNVIMYYQYDGGIPAKEDIKLVCELDFFRDFCYDMKTLADAGAWSRSALTNTVTDDDAFGNLQGASIAWNGSVFTYMEQAEKTEGVECAAYDVTQDHLVSAEAYSNNDMAITAGSQNPERAAMVLDLMKFDTYLNRLLILGIEGDHYSINEQNEYSELENSTNFAANALSVSWAIKNGELKEAGVPEREQVITDAWEERVEMNPTITFVFDDTNVTAYMSAVDSVLADYIPMLQLGLVDDVDATIDECIQKCYDAGLQNIYDEFYTQYDAWAATR